MALSVQDRIEIGDLIAMHGHLMDAGELDRMDELFTAEITYDVNDLGFGELHGIPALQEAAVALGNGNPVGHHITNVVIAEADGAVRGAVEGDRHLRRRDQRQRRIRRYGRACGNRLAHLVSPGDRAQGAAGWPGDQVGLGRQTDRFSTFLSYILVSRIRTVVR
ncbi:nuclear transport factor 2 family protein [Nocardia vinacea]|uniref:nuclear transport factor 2 family protein n=1 Tax=Nocardia vinacea TaxID=96468 RepID=UPI003406C21A